MFWMIFGAGVGYIWGVLPACIGFLVGMMVNAITNDQAVALNAGSSDENSQDIPVLNDFVDDGTRVLSFSDDSSTSLVNHGMDINPANGLPMVGCLDVEGNVYGFDDVHEIADTSFDFGSDDSLVDDSFGCGMNDW